MPTRLYEKQVPVACIVITDPMKPAPHSPLLLKKLFGLTPTEARIAQHLTSGDTPTQTAEVVEHRDFDGADSHRFDFS